MKRTLIIGGNGFVGSNLTDRILERTDSRIWIIDNLLSSDKPENDSDERVTFLQADAGILENFKSIPTDIDTVFLLHCLHGNQSSLHDPLLDLDNSLRPTIATLEWVRRSGINPKIVYAGAGCAVAHKTWDSPEAVVETDTVHLYHDSPYSISKLAGEMHSVMYAEQFNLDVSRARFQNVYGPGEFLGAGRWRGTNATIWRNVVPSFVWKAINNQNLTVTGDKASRDFIYVSDLSEGLIAIANVGIKGEAYNLASGVETNILELAELIIEMTQSNSKIEIKSSRYWDNSGRRYGSVSKSSLKLNFNAKTLLTDGIKKTIEWTRANSDLIDWKISRHKDWYIET